MGFFGWIKGKLAKAIAEPETCPCCSCPVAPTLNFDGWTFAVRVATVREMVAPDQYVAAVVPVFLVTNGKAVQVCRVTRGEMLESRN